MHALHARTIVLNLIGDEVMLLGNLSIRRLDDETMQRLRTHAAEHVVSMEEEARRIIREAVSTPGRLADLAVNLFGPEYGVEVSLDSRPTHEPIDADP